jgi:hypothetical protein
MLMKLINKIKGGFRFCYVFFLTHLKIINKYISKVDFKNRYIRIGLCILVILAVIAISFFLFNISTAVIIAVILFVMILSSFFLYGLIEHKKSDSINYIALTKDYNLLKRKYTKLNINIKKIPWLLLLGDDETGKDGILQNPKFKLIKLRYDDNIKNEINWYYSPEFLLVNINKNLFTKEYSEKQLIDDNIRISANASYLLKFLRKKRPKIPVNTVLITVPCDTVAKSSSDDLTIYGRNLACFLKYIHERMRVCFPLYLFISKIDMITGFNEFIGSLNDKKEGSNIVGWNNPKSFGEALDYSDICDDLICLIQDISNFTFSMISTTKPQVCWDYNDSTLAKLYAFHWNFEKLVRKLLKIFNTTFEKYKWIHELPPMRGIYFVSSFADMGTIDNYKCEKTGSFVAAESTVDIKEISLTSLNNIFKKRIFKELNLVTSKLNKDYFKQRNKYILLTITFAVLFIFFCIWSCQSYLLLNPQTTAYNKFVDNVSPEFFKPRTYSISEIKQMPRNYSIGESKPVFALPKLYTPFLLRRDVNDEVSNFYDKISTIIKYGDFLNAIHNRFYPNVMWNDADKSTLIYYLSKYYDLGKISIYLCTYNDFSNQDSSKDASRLWFAMKMLQKNGDRKTKQVVTRGLNETKIGDLSTRLSSPIKFLFYSSKREMVRNKSECSFIIPQGWSILDFLFDGSKYRPPGYDKNYFVTWDHARKIPNTDQWVTKIKIVPKQGNDVFFYFKFQLPSEFSDFAKFITKREIYTFVG